jgi:small-conductance mechanosensitive channel
MRRLPRRLGATILVVLAVSGAAVSAQPTPPAAPLPQSLGTPPNVERAGTTAWLVYFNRPIVELRARIFGREPADRASVATRVLDDLAAAHIAGPVLTSPVEGGSLISVGGRLVVGVSIFDVDELAGETLGDVTARAAGRLQVALAEAIEARRPATLARNAGIGAAAIALAALILWALSRTRRFAIVRLAAMSAATMARAGLGGHDVLRSSRLLEFERSLLTSLTIGLQLVVVYLAATFLLRLFPYTRPWGEAMSGYLFQTLVTLGLGILHAIPGLFMVLVIVVLTRLAVRLAGVWFSAVERGRISLTWMYPEAARPTRRLVTGLLWLFALVMSYPYLPGSSTDAFKGVSLFIGAIVTLGSSGLMNQVMSGFVVAFSRALRVGSFVRIGDVEGTVTHLGVLSTKVRTLMDEEVTIPHAVVVSQKATDYSRFADAPGVLTPISVTIGYDAPWRQVHALLLVAADRTPGLRRPPAPHVRQSSLEDFYVRYTLYVSLERQEDRLVTLDALNRNIQDAFNEHGVQIMSPNYMVDPQAPKVVPKAKWFAAPAKPDGQN